MPPFGYQRQRISSADTELGPGIVPGAVVVALGLSTAAGTFVVNRANGAAETAWRGGVIFLGDRNLKQSRAETRPSLVRRPPEKPPWPRSVHFFLNAAQAGRALKEVQRNPLLESKEGSS
jgi:hypothetical protein